MHISLIYLYIGFGTIFVKSLQNAISIITWALVYFDCFNSCLAMLININKGVIAPFFSDNRQLLDRYVTAVIIPLKEVYSSNKCKWQLLDLSFVVIFHTVPICGSQEFGR